MGFFNFGNKKQKEIVEQLDNNSKKINLDKKERINLRKELVGELCSTHNLSEVKSKIGLVLDFSYSMSSLYKKGAIQEVLEKIIPLALNFDDDGSLDVWIFSNTFKRLESVTLNNYENFIKDVVMKNEMGGTSYSPVMKDVFTRYIEEEKSNFPNYVLFLTDGDNNDKEETTKIIKKYSDYPIFWQFVGIGNESFSFLQKLDDLKGRTVDNADFFKISNIEKISDKDLYNKLLNEYPDWIEKAKNKNIL